MNPYQAAVHLPLLRGWPPNRVSTVFFNTFFLFSHKFFEQHFFKICTRVLELIEECNIKKIISVS